MDYRPLVLEADPNVLGDPGVVLQKLQPGDDLDIPLAVEVDNLKQRFALLVGALREQGILLPVEFFVDL